jgi:GNAT superfamily N-acetyltransferase
MGYEVERSEFGYYMRNARAPRLAQVTVCDLGPGDVPRLVSQVRRHYAGRPVRILVDDRALDDTLGPELVNAGCEKSHAEVHLAHVGPVPQVAGVPGLTLQHVTEAALESYVRLKLRGFAHSEADPSDGEVKEEVALRRAELAGDGRFLIAALGGEPASVIGWYEGPDRFIFQLATRLPFRRSGIARILLCHLLTEAEAQGCRSVLINTDPEDTPIQAYRRLGFTDEVYWRREYRLAAEPSPS